MPALPCNQRWRRSRLPAATLLSVPILIACRSPEPLPQPVIPVTRASEVPDTKESANDDDDDVPPTRPDSLCEVMLDEFENDPFGCSHGLCNCHVRAFEELEGQPWKAAALFNLDSGDHRLWQEELAVFAGGEWQRVGFLVFEEHNLPAIDGSAQLEIDELDSSSPGPELVINVTLTRLDLTIEQDDGGLEELGRTQMSFVVVCGSAEGGWCVTLPTELHGDDEEHRAAAYDAELEFDGAGSVTIDTTDARWAGTKALRELERVAGFPWFEPHWR